MNTCENCSNRFNDGVQCTMCKKFLDFGCANVTESSYRRLNAKAKASWKCSSCVSGLPAPPASSSAKTPESVSLDMIMGKLTSMECKLNSMESALANIPKLTSDVEGIKTNISKLQESNRNVTKKIQEYTSKVDDTETRVTCLEASVSDLAEVRSQVLACQRNDLFQDQLTRLNNVEIKGVPLKKTEDLFDIVDRIGARITYKIAKSQINYVSRIPTFNSKDKSIVVSFLNRYVKEDFIASARLLKSLSAADIGFENNNQRIYVNDHLSPEYKKLLTQVKQLAKEREYQFTWVKFSKIHVRKDDSSPVITVKSEADLNKLV